MVSSRKTLTMSIVSPSAGTAPGPPMSAIIVRTNCKPARWYGSAPPRVRAEAFAPLSSKSLTTGNMRGRAHGCHDWTAKEEKDG